MLNGIGGKTIAEAKENISHQESIAWAKYIAKRGSINIGKRIEYGVARLAATWMQTQGYKVDITDFMPYADKSAKNDSDQPASIQQAFGLLAAIKKTSSK